MNEMSEITEQQLEKMSGRIKMIKNYRHMHIRDIANTLGISVSYLFVAAAALRERGMIEQKSPVGMVDLARYHRLDSMMASDPALNISTAVRAIYVNDTPKNRYKMRCLIENCCADGRLDMSNIKKLKVETISRSKSGKGPLRFITIEQVDPEALAAFVGICQMNGGRHAA